MVVLPENVKADIAKASFAVVVFGVMSEGRLRIGFTRVGTDATGAIGLIERAKFGILAHALKSSERELGVRDDLPKFDVKRGP